jgi:predicted DsbA family dithiol-disulfide isomerase
LRFGRSEARSAGVNLLSVTVFSDFTCPHSYISEALLWRSAGTDLELRFRALELFPWPATPGPDIPEFSPDEWAHILRSGADAGIVFNLPAMRPRTGKAHEAARFARDRGLEVELRREIFAAFWADGADIGRIDVLTAIAGMIGIDPEELKIALDIDRYAGEIHADNDLAGRLRIPGTPTIFLGTGPSARVIVGARPVGELMGLLNDAIRSGMENE